ncbi:MAG: UbiA family prenyltransferase [Gemmataceae bacterium]
MRVLPYAQLLRLPNVFTAFADVLMGTFATGALLAKPAAAVLLLLASGCLYCGGMVWNDFFDFAEDRRDRPFRPLPAGKIAKRTAVWLGAGLLAAGVGCAALTMFLNRPDESWNFQPVGIALILVVVILLYDGWLKRTPIGPIGMGACRFLNVLLAVSVAGTAPLPANLRWHLAAVVGLYIVGVTWFARAEAGRSKPNPLRGAAAVMLAGLLLALAVPVHRSENPHAWALPYLLVVFGFLIGLPVVRAIGEPDAGTVQAAVKRCILGLVVLDAILATVFVGPCGLLIVLLLPPALLLGRRVYST